jgi:hypothetical protein
MLINLRDNKQKLVIKDILDIDFDMFVEGGQGGYFVRVNEKYHLDEEFANESDAENRMRFIADARNGLEAELKNY